MPLELRGFYSVGRAWDRWGDGRERPLPLFHGPDREDRFRASNQVITWTAQSFSGRWSCLRRSVARREASPPRAGVFPAPQPLRRHLRQARLPPLQRR